MTARARLFHTSDPLRKLGLRNGRGEGPKDADIVTIHLTWLQVFKSLGGGGHACYKQRAAREISVKLTVRVLA